MRRIHRLPSDPCMVEIVQGLRQMAHCGALGALYVDGCQIRVSVGPPGLPTPYSAPWTRRISWEAASRMTGIPIRRHEPPTRAEADALDAEAKARTERRALIHFAIPRSGSDAQPVTTSAKAPRILR